jgi:phage terminase large subunit-like protein
LSTATDDSRLKLERLETLRALQVAKATGREPWHPEPYQLPPRERFYLWFLCAGRGAGKSSACAAYFDRFMRQNPGSRGSIIAPTLGDAAESCLYGPWALLAHNPLIRMRARLGGTRLFWPNGSEAMVFGAHSRDDVERQRAGGNRDVVWAEEVAAWRYLRETWENMELGLRESEWPHIVASTTPKTRPFLRTLLEDPETVVTRATTFDNPHLPEAQRERLRARWAGSRWERQELFGEYVEDVEGALWTFETIANCRVEPDDVPDLVRVVEGVDPSGGDEDGNDEQGIVVAGKGVDGDYYVLTDRSCKLSPDGWGKRAVAAGVEFRADRIVCESNFGGDMVVATVKVAAAALDVEVAVKKISASRGKVARAEPIAALYEQGKVHHVGSDMEALESQMRNWTPDSGWSPDRVDACVWALTELVEGHTPTPMRVLSAKGRIRTQDDRFLPGF